MLISLSEIPANLSDHFSFSFFSMPGYQGYCNSTSSLIREVENMIMIELTLLKMLTGTAKFGIPPRMIFTYSRPIRTWELPMEGSSLSLVIAFDSCSKIQIFLRRSLNHSKEVINQFPMPGVLFHTRQLTDGQLELFTHGFIKWHHS